MLFDIEADHGNALVAYVVPDSGSTTSSIRLRANGVDLLTLEANDPRPNLIAAGRHSTGQCGFVIDERHVPGLAAYADLEIVETSHDVRVYRRRPPRAIDVQIFRLETQLVPLDPLDDAFEDRFQYWYPGIDRFGLETSTQVFCLEAASLFVSGRLLLKNFDHYLTKGVKTVGLIRDPFHELAERLLLLKRFGVKAGTALSARDAMTFARAIAALQIYDLAEASECRRFFTRASEGVLKALSNPLVRQLTTGAPDEMPAASGVAAALDALAGFEILGLRSDVAAFNSSLAELAGVDPTLLPIVDEHPDVLALGDRLRKIPVVEDIIEKDLEVFSVLTQAFSAADACSY